MAKPKLNGSLAGIVNVARPSDQEFTPSDPLGAAPITKPFKPYRAPRLTPHVRRSSIEDAPSVIGGIPRPKE